MNKNLIIGLVLVLLLGGGGYYFMTKNSASIQPTGMTQEQPTGISSGSVAKSLKDLLMSGVAQKCTFSDKQQNVDMTGTTYITSGKVRGDFNSTVNGKLMVSHMIVDGKISYMWTDDGKTGFKFAFDPQSSQVKGATQQQGSLDVNKTIDYKCNPGAVDSSMFTPPASVKFTDYSTIVAPSGSNTGTGTNIGCSACNSLSGDEKAQCLSALKCS